MKRTNGIIHCQPRLVNSFTTDMILSPQHIVDSCQDFHLWTQVGFSGMQPGALIIRDAFNQPLLELSLRRKNGLYYCDHSSLGLDNNPVHVSSFDALPAVPDFWDDNNRDVQPTNPSRHFSPCTSTTRSPYTASFCVRSSNHASHRSTRTARFLHTWTSRWSSLRQLTRRLGILCRYGHSRERIEVMQAARRPHPAVGIGNVGRAPRLLRRVATGRHPCLCRRPPYTV